ncbi:uncharacterized protein LOC135831415 isoform X8 [Planococcus citri]|uniref:uncharacterized protein LOC135831415 isoform X8 n=1 Tax=Planococcus citri TaxID=170843 RepID=UPI0031F8F248
MSDPRMCPAALLRLALNCVTKRLWLSEINNDWFETRVLNNEKVKDKLRLNHDFKSLLPSSINEMLMINIDAVGKQISDTFAPLSAQKLIRLVFEEREWRDFAASICNLVKETGLNYNDVQEMFKNIIREIDSGSLSVSSDEISFYLSVWKSLPKDLKSRIIVNLSCHEGRKIGNQISASADYIAECYGPQDISVKNFPRDLQFFTNLMLDFDPEERKKIWLENYPELIVAASPCNLQRLMEVCFDKEEQIVEFKRRYFVERGYADRYCLRIIEKKCFAELNKFLGFCTNNELEAEELTKRILHKYFATNGIPHGYDALFEMFRSGGCICRVLKLAEFQYLFRLPAETVKAYCYKLIDQGNFERVKEFLNIFFPSGKNASSFLQEVIKTFFSDNNLYEPKFTGLWLLSKLEKFNHFIDSLFATSEAAAVFRKEIMFSESVFNFVGFVRFSEDVEPFGISPFDEEYDIIVSIEKFPTTFLPSELDLSKWKEDFAIYSLKCMRQWRWFIFCRHGGHWDEVSAWLFNSEEKASRFKALLSMDEILSCYPRLTLLTLSRYFYPILRWYYSNDEEQIVFFMLQALRESSPDFSYTHTILLGNSSDQFAQCTNDSERLATLRQIFRDGGRF